MEVLTLNKKGITDFAAERNNMLANANSKWVLFLDSDERLSSRINLTTDEYNGFYLRRKNYFLGKFVGSEWLLRLGKKNEGKWRRRVHETWEIKGKVGKLTKPLIIHNTAENLHDYIAKINYYSTLHARANRDEGKKSSLFKIIFFPRWKFIFEFAKSKHLVFSLMQSFHSFLAWSKLYFLGS